jgi:hypothetical protein
MKLGGAIYQIVGIGGSLPPDQDTPRTDIGDEEHFGKALEAFLALIRRVGDAVQIGVLMFDPQPVLVP